ncbi:hypothetical protein [Moraxella oblonga]|uniref:hypothetical protein n=1 Tax=Moraxella oblonga TaxID=200413 RepID=UPI0008366D82|nr:hypothetical protein [Moraxella oblonga]
MTKPHNEQRNQKEFMIVSVIDTLSSIVLALALCSYFAFEKPKTFAINLIVLSIIISLCTRFFAKQDKRAKMIAKLLGLPSVVVLVILYFI